VAIRAAGVPRAPAAPTTTVNSNVSVKIDWTAPSNGGNSIQSYLVKIREDGGTYSTVPNCNDVATNSCTVPISVLKAAPYELAWGSIVKATVIARNAVGSSEESAAGGEAIIVTNPNPPNPLNNNALVTSESVIGLTWVEPAENGGSPVIDYRVSWDQGRNEFVVL